MRWPIVGFFALEYIEAMAITTAQDLAQRALDYSLLTQHQMQNVWGELGSGNASLDDMRKALLGRDLLTFWQVEHLIAENRETFFYGNFKVLYLVGTGTFARVYRASNTEKNERQVAVKVLRKRFAEIRTEADRFYREGKMGMALRHPNIVPIYDVGTESGVPYLVIEFVEGQNLRDFLKVRKRIQPQEAARLIQDVCQGLQYALDCGVHHRDMKLSNVLVSSRGQAKLVDFGLAGAGEEASDDDLARNPNPRAIDYAGLERSSGVAKNDPRSDTFFVGCMLYQMLTGEPPMSETRDRMQRLSRARYADITPITQLEAGLPPTLVAVVNRAIQFDPERRYQSPAEMAIDLTAFLEGKAPAAVAAQAQKPSAAQAEANKAAREGLDEQGRPRKLMIVESDAKMQDVFRERFKRNGYRVLLIADPSRAMRRFSEEDDVADVVIFSTSEVGRSALESFNALVENDQTKNLPAVLLLGERHKSWKSEADTAPHRSVLAMPIKFRDLREAVLGVLVAESGK